LGCVSVDVGLRSCGYDVGIWAGNHERLVAIIGPSHPIGRFTVGGVHREDLCPPRMVGDVAAFDHEPIAGLCAHRCPLLPDDRASRVADVSREQDVRSMPVNGRSQVAENARTRGDGRASKTPVVWSISMLGFAAGFKGSAAAG
jgi:hypothetical protein